MTHDLMRRAIARHQRRATLCKTARRAFDNEAAFHAEFDSISRSIATLLKWEFPDLPIYQLKTTLKEDEIT